MAAANSKLLTAKQVASICDVHETTVTRWCRLEKIKHIRLPGGLYRFTRAAVDRVVREISERRAVALED